MSSGGVTFGILGHLFAIGFVVLDAGKTEQGNGDVAWALGTNTGETKGSGRGRFVCYKVPVVCAAKSFDEAHPAACVLLKIRYFVGFNHIPHETSNQSAPLTSGSSVN